jgi:hypothetical protein
MEPKLTALVLFTLVTGFCMVPAIAQHPMLKYNVFLDFTSYFGVDSVTVSLHDQSGRVVATATSPFGGEIEVSFMTPTPVSALTASATGRVSIGSSWDQYARIVSGTTTIVVGTDELYYWITVLMH